MKIILISDLYPAYPGHSVEDISYALHYFAKLWISCEDVLVIRPYIVPKLFKQDPVIGKGDYILDKVRIFNCPVAKFPKFRLFYLNSIFNYLKKNKYFPDVVIAHLGFNLLFGHRTAEHYKVPFISAVHQGDLKKGIRMLTEKKFREIYQGASGIACRSLSVYDEFAKMFPGLKGKCFTAYSGINRNMILNSDFGISKLKRWRKNRDIKFISVCSLIPLKNIDVNLKVMSRLDKGVDWKYTIVERNNLIKLAEELGISSRVRFTGVKDRQEVLEEMRGSHIFIMVSSPETFGLAYLEAMATGNIVIGSKGAGVDGIIKNNKNGFLCAPGNETELFDTINKIIFKLNTEAHAKILVQCNKTIREYTDEKAADNYLNNIYKYCKK